MRESINRGNKIFVESGDGTNDLVISGNQIIIIYL